MLGFGMVTEFITIDNIKLGVDTNNGLELDVTVGLDSVYTIGLGLNQLRASVDPDKRADYAVTVNKDNFAPESTTDGVPDAVHVEVGGSLFIKNKLGESGIKLSNDYNFTETVAAIFNNSVFNKSDLDAIYAQIEEENKDVTMTDKAKKVAAWKRLASMELTEAEREELDIRYGWAVKDIAANVDEIEEWYDAVPGDDTHYALAWDYLVENSIMVDLNGLGMDILAQFLGEMDDSLDFNIDVWLDFSNIYRSVLKVEIIRSLIGEEKECALTFIYDGSDVDAGASSFAGDVYVSTSIFSIGDVVLRNVTGVINGIMEVFDSTFITALGDAIDKFIGITPDTASNASAAENGTSSGFNAAALADADIATYLDIMFNDGSLGIAVTKATLISVIALAGVDLTEALRNIDFGADISLGFKGNLNLTASVYLDNEGEVVEEGEHATEIGLTIGNINADFDDSQIITEEDKNKDYAEVEEFTTVGLHWGGLASFKLSNLTKNFNFDYAVKMFTNYWLDGRDPEIGLQLDVDGKFEQTTYFSINANVNLTTLKDLKNIELYLNRLLREIRIFTTVLLREGL